MWVKAGNHSPEMDSEMDPGFLTNSEMDNHLFQTDLQYTRGNFSIKWKLAKDVTVCTNIVLISNA